MKVIVLTTSYPRIQGDYAGIFVSRLVDAFSRLKLSGEVIVPLDKDEPKSVSQGNFVIHRFRYGLFRRGALCFGAGIMPNLRRQPWLILQAPGVIIGFLLSLHRVRQEAVVVHANWIFAGYAALIGNLLWGQPYVLSVLGEDLRLIRKLPRILWLPVLKRAKKVVAISRAFKQELERTASISCELIPNGIEISESDIAVTELYQINPHESYLLFVGRLIPLKRVHQLVELLAQAPLSEYVLLLAGRADDPQYFDLLKHLAEKLGVSNRVRFLGAVAPNHVGTLIRTAKAFFNPSEFEGHPNAVLEALAGGLPVFVSDIEAHREMIIDGENGVIVAFGDPPQAARQVAGVLKDPTRANTLSLKAKASVAHLTWDKAAEQYRALFN